MFAGRGLGSGQSSSGGREVAAPATAAHVRLDVPRRDDRRRSLGFGLGPHELGLAVPRVAVGVHLDPAGARPHRAAAWQLAAREVFAGAKSEHVQAAIAAANRVLVEVVVDDAVAGADLVRLLVDPRQTGAAEHVEDLLCLAVDVRGRRHLARTEFHPSHTTARAPRGGAEVGPGAGHLAPLVAPLLDVVPVRDSHGATLDRLITTGIETLSRRERPARPRNVRPPRPPVHPLRAAPTLPPPGRARAVPRAGRRGVRPRVRALRSGRAGPAPRGPRPCRRG